MIPVWPAKVDMAFNTESFCPELYNAIEIDEQGDFKICCLANSDANYGVAMTQDGVKMNIMTHSIYEAINSSTHNAHRLLLKDNIKPERCKTCYQEEAAHRIAGGTHDSTKRLVNLSRDYYVKADQAHDYTNQDGSLTNLSKIKMLSLRFGNICNFKCIMCSPKHSHLWADDHVKIYGTTKFNKGKSIYEIPSNERGKLDARSFPWWETDQWWKKFDEVIPTLSSMYFTGGEPFLIPAMGECLDRLIEAGVSKNITLQYDSNMSVINDNIIEKFEKFKGVTISASVDDTEERFELIRDPGKYDVVLDNIKNILSMKEKKHNININMTITSCIGIASPYVTSRIIPLAEELNCDTFFRYLEGPKWLSLKYMSPGSKLQMIRELTSMKNSVSKDLTKTIYQTQINFLHKFMNLHDPIIIRTFVTTMDKLDELRNHDWKKTLPDVYELLYKYSPEAFK